MKTKIRGLLILGIIHLSMYEGFSQDMTVNFKTSCVETSSCNPFYNGFACQAAIIHTTHGSPRFYLPSSDRQVEMLAEVASSGTQYGEGFIINYAFQPNKTYTVKIQHKAIPQQGVVAPKLIAALTDNPPKQDDLCDLGHLGTTDVYSSQEFIVSATVETSTFTITPTKQIPYLWLRTVPAANPRAGILLLSVQFDDHSDNSTNPPTGPGYNCSGPAEFCEPGHNFLGSFDIRHPETINIRCDAFTSPGNPNGPVINRRFSAKEINLSDGFVANAADGVDWQLRFFLALPSENPCFEVLSIYGIVFAKQVKSDFVDLKPVVNLSRDTEISIYPTPTSGLVKIFCNARSLAGGQITVVDQSGRVVRQSPLNSNVNNADVNLNHLTNGVYFLKVNTSFNSVTKKIVIQK